MLKARRFEFRNSAQSQSKTSSGELKWTFHSCYLHTTGIRLKYKLYYFYFIPIEII